MLRTLSTLLLLSLGSMAAFCQVPGYLGKRLSLQGEFHSFPALGGPTAANKGLQVHYGEEGGGFGLNWSAGARLGYVMSRQGQVVLSFDYLKTGMTQTAYTPATSFFGEQDFDSHYLFYNLTGLSGGIGIRQFKPLKGALAPMGRYNGYSLSATYLKGKILDKQTTYVFGGSTGHLPLGIEPKQLSLSFGYETGVNFVIKDRFLLSVGAKLNIPLSPRFYRFALGEEASWYPYSGSSDVSYEEGNTENFKELAATRYAYHSLIMFYIGVGLLQ